MPLGTPVGDFLEMRRPTLNLGHTLVAATSQDLKEVFCFCLLAVALSGKFIHPTAEVFLCLY